MNAITNAITNHILNAVNQKNRSIVGSLVSWASRKEEDDNDNRIIFVPNELGRLAGTHKITSQGVELWIEARLKNLHGTYVEVRTQQERIVEWSGEDYFIKKAMREGYLKLKGRRATLDSLTYII